MAEDILATKSAFLRSRSTALLTTNFGNGLVPRLVFDASQPPSSDVVDDDADADAVAEDAMDIDCSSGYINTRGHMAHLSTNEATAIFPYRWTVLKLQTTDLRVPQLMLFRNKWGSMIDIFNERKRAGEEALSLQVSWVLVSTIIGISLSLPTNELGNTCLVVFHPYSLHH